MDQEQKKREQLEKLTKMMPVLIAVLGLLYAALFYVFVLMPKLGRIIEGGSYDLAPVQKVYDSEVGYQKMLQGHLDKMKLVNDTQKLTVQSMVPVGVDFPGLIVTLDAIGYKNNVQLLSLDLSPDDSVLSGGRKAMKATASFAGGDYGTFKAMLRDIEHSRRIIDVQNTSFSPGASTFSLNFRVYYVDPPSVK